jgi:hypothetical protein
MSGTLIFRVSAGGEILETACPQGRFFICRLNGVRARRLQRFGPSKDFLKPRVARSLSVVRLHTETIPLAGMREYRACGNRTTGRIRFGDGGIGSLSLAKQQTRTETTEEVNL